MENIKDLTLKLEGNAQVINILSNNAEIVNKVSKFQVAVEQLNSNQQKLVELHALLSRDITPVEKVYNDRRKDLEEKTMSVIRIMQVFAHDKKKNKLQRRLYHLTTEYIQSCPDMDLIKLSKKIWLMANKFGGYALTFVTKIKASLNPDHSKATNKFEKEFGLNSVMIRNIEEANIRFIDAMLNYTGVLKQKEKVAMKIKKINKQTKKLLANKIDRFALLFETENPDFYNEYCGLRDKQLQKKVKATVAQETDFSELLVNENQLNVTEPKPKPKRKTTPKPAAGTK